MKVCHGTYFGNDLARRIHPQTGHLRHPLNCVLVLVLVEHTRDPLVQLVHLLFDHLQLLQRHLREPAVSSVEFGAAPGASHNYSCVVRNR